MLRNFFIIVIVILFSGIVLAAPPTVDFNYTPNIPGIFAPITFNPDINTNLDLNILFWGFDTDGNVNFTRTFTPLDINIIFSDNFDTNTLSGYDTNAGTWSSPTPQNYLKGGAFDGAAISHTVSMTAGRDYNIFYKNDPSFTSLNNMFFFFTDQNGIGNINGYDVLLQSATTRLRRWVNGTPTNLITYPGQSIGTYHDVNVSIRTDGNIQVWIDSNSIGSVTDLTYTSGSRIVFSTANGTTDGNWDNVKITAKATGGGSFNPVTPISLTQSQTHTFNTSGTKSVCLTAGNSDGNTTHCEDIVLIGNIRFKVYDENTHAQILNARGIFDGQTFSSDSNGLIIISTPTISEEKTIEIYAPGYPSRFFTYNLDINSSISDSVYLLDENKGREIEFLIRDINSIKYPNYFFQVIKDGNIVSRNYLDNRAISIPIYVSNLTNSYNFYVDGNSTSGTNIFNYGNSTLQIGVPYNESNLSILTPFGINISDITSIDGNNFTSLRNFQIYPNTFHPYKITIDANNLDYFERYYTVRSLGGQVTVFLQPYLLRAIDNGIPATMIVKDSLSSLSLQYYQFKLFTDINQSSNVLAEAPQTDSAGTFIFTTVTGKTYFIKIYDPFGDLIKQGQFISSTNTQYFVDLASGVIAGQSPQTGNVDINLLIPTNNFFFLNDSNNFGLRFITNTNGPSITGVNVQILNGSSTLYNNTFTPSFPATVYPNGTIFDANFATSLNNINTRVIITLTTSLGNVSKTYQFPLKQDSNPTISFPGFGTFCSNVGGLGCAFIWLFIGLLISLGLRFNPIFGVDNNAMFWVMAIWTGVSAFIGIVPYQIGFIAILAGASFWTIRNRPIG